MASASGDFFTDQFADAKLDSKLSRSEAEAHWIARRVPGDRILDIGCGRGRVSIPLASLGRSVTGLDSNQGYLEVARQRSADLGVDVDWRCMADVELDDKNQFDGAISLFTSFGYHSDAVNREVLERVARALRPDGVLILEIQNRDAPRTFEEASAEEITPSGQRIEKRYVFDPRTSRRSMTFSYFEGDQATGVGSLDYRLYSVHEMLRLLEETGFKDVELYGNARGLAYEPLGEHIVYVGSKR